MNRIHFAAALLSLSVITPASAKSEAVTFKHDGVSYTYKVKTIGEGKRIISGYATPGAPFRLVVSGDTVSGTADGMPVTFKVSEAKGRVAMTGATIALR